MSPTLREDADRPLMTSEPSLAQQFVEQRTELGSAAQSRQKTGRNGEALASTESAAALAIDRRRPGDNVDPFTGTIDETRLDANTDVGTCGGSCSSGSVEGASCRLVVSPRLLRHSRIQRDGFQLDLAEDILRHTPDGGEFGWIGCSGGDTRDARCHATSRRKVDVASSTINTANPMSTPVSSQSAVRLSPRIITPRRASLA